VAQLARGEEANPPSPVRLAADSGQRSTLAQEAAERTDVRGFIDRKLRESWQAAGVVPSRPATDGEWCRRLYLDLLGRIPTVEELNAYLADKSRDRREKLVKRLLSAEYAEDYARNWTTLWTNLLIGRSGGNDDGERRLVNRAGLEEYLRQSLEQNKPYDQMVQELLTATGTNAPGRERFNGAVNFLTGKLQDDATQATAKTAQLFLGLQVQCTQCHDHPFNEWKQNQFWELNAFFRQARPLRRYEGLRLAYVDLVDEDFPGQGERRPGEAPIFYELRSGKVAVAYPVFVDGRAPSKPGSDGQPQPIQSGLLSDVNRRQELARFVVSSPEFARAMVNRMWGHFLGYGFTKPVDDMGPHNAPVLPEVLDRLAEEFRMRSYDVKELIRPIVLSEAYSLSSSAGRKNAKDDPTLGEKPLFSRFYLRQMRAEELYQSLLVATRADQTRGSKAAQERARREWLEQFVTAFGTDDAGEMTTFDGTIPQALMMMNGELMQQATSTDEGSFLRRVAANDKLKNPAKIERLYLAAVARRPTKAELQAANALLVARQGNAVAALQDMWWALLNSNEFILNH
jgi:hypothetical protein